LVFCNTKSDTQDVADELAHYGFYALAIHGDLDQRERDQALIRFSNGSGIMLWRCCRCHHHNLSSN
jgi:ATP-independent RNA helicase DbpA